MPTVSGPRPPPRRPPYSPPTISAALATASCGYKGSAPPTSSPFSSSSSTHAPPLLLLAPCRCRPPHPGPPSAASFSHPLPHRRLLELHPAPVHLYDPSNSGPDHPSSPSPPLLPAQRTPPQIASSVSPRPPQLLQSNSFRLDVAPCPLSHRSRTSGSPESTAAGSHGLPPLFPAMGQKVRWARVHYWAILAG
jgi:hypothetical protein